MRRVPIMLAGVTIAATLLSAMLPVARLLVWNATDSVPKGLYAIGGASDLRVGERVALHPPPHLRAYLTRRGYVPDGVPLLKEIAALRGDRICRRGAVITINGAIAGSARGYDSRRRPLPAWQGCRTIAEGELFVMNRHVADSFDGRYFGPLPRAAVLGRAIPLWTDAAGKSGPLRFASQPEQAHPRTHKHHGKETRP